MPRVSSSVFRNANVTAIAAAALTLAAGAPPAAMASHPGPEGRTAVSVYHYCNVKTNPDFAMGRQGWLQVSNDTCARGKAVAHAYILRYRTNTSFVVRSVLGYSCKAAYASDELLIIRCSKVSKRIRFVYRAFH